MKIRDMLINVSIIFSILAGLITIVAPFMYLNQIQDPYLTIEYTHYSLPEGKSSAIITIRNEGRVTAEDIRMFVYTRGEVENMKGQIGAVTGEIEVHDVLMPGDVTLYKGPDGPDSCYAEIKCIPKGMKYTLTLIVRYRGFNPIEGKPLVWSEKAGIVEEYTPMQNSNLFLNFLILGLIGGICLTGAIFTLYLKKKKD